jgi:hypothetical protein
MACDAEMILMKVAADDTMPVPGFEHHTFMCSGCRDVERRLVFAGTRVRENAGEPPPVHAARSTAEEQAENEPVDLADTAPSIAPALATRHEPAAGGGLFRRVVARMRSLSR